MAGQCVMVKRGGLITLGLWLILWGGGTRLEAAPLPTPTRPDPKIIRLALQQALNLNFDAALTTAAQLKTQNQPTFGSEWLRGIIAYLQLRWQTHHSPSASKIGRKALSDVLESGQDALSSAQPEPWLQMMLGLAAVFNALLQSSEVPWLRLQGLAQGQTWLQNARIADADTADAHLGLGLIALERSQATGVLQFLSRQTAGLASGGTPISQALHHLQQAAETSHFSQSLARVFLAQLYEQEQHYKDALTVGQTLQLRFPNNGSFTLLIGRSQCGLSRLPACVLTLSRLADRLKTTPSILVQRDDRFDLYYQWATALTELGRDDEAFTAFRSAINQDPRAAKDETLWAKFHLAGLYQRKGQHKTARQLYQTLLRGRRVEELQERVKRQLATLN